jgi:hypothetical protein
MLFEFVQGGNVIFQAGVFLRNVALISAFIAPTICGAQSQAASGASPQMMLDFLAKPAPQSGPTLKTGPLPSHFADWPDDKKKSRFLQTAQHCALVNALEHDNPASRILPPPMSDLEESELAVSVCVPAKMPADWPDRRKYLDDAQRLIAKARSYGSTLQLPANLATK